MLIKCKECGSEISSMAKFCPKCGFPVQKKSKSYITSLVFGIISIVYGLGMLVNCYFNQDISLVLPFVVIVSILSIVFGSISLKNTKKNITGMVLGTITLLICVITLFM